MIDLEARLVALEDRLGHLERQLGSRRTSMAQSRRCPACGSDSLFHFPHVTERQHAAIKNDFSLHHRDGWFSREDVASLEAFACRGCRLVEWHARSLEDVVADGVQVIAIGSSPEPARWPTKPEPRPVKSEPPVAQTHAPQRRSAPPAVEAPEPSGHDFEQELEALKRGPR